MLPLRLVRAAKGALSAAVIGMMLVSRIPAGAEEPPLEVGWIGPMSGVTASLGHWDTQGIMLAFEQQNAKGGIFGRKLQLLTLDDAGDPTQTVNNVKRLLGQTTSWPASAVRRAATHWWPNRFSRKHRSLRSPQGSR